MCYIDYFGLHSQPINETVNGQTVTTAERVDLRVLLDETNGVLQIDGNIIKIQALGGYAEIDLKSMNDGVHLINDHLHFSYGEFFELLGLDYTKTALTVQVTRQEEKKNRFSYALKNLTLDLASGATIKPVESIFGGFGAIFDNLSGFLYDLSIDTEASPPIVPRGTYQINQYIVEGKVIVQQQIGVSSGNNYYSADYIYWNPENPAYILDTFFGWERP